LNSFFSPRSERIKSKKELDLIFKNGNTLLSFDKKIKAHYLVLNNSENPKAKFAVAISKKSGTAVWRNRVKRLLRQIYRENKFLLKDSIEEKKISLMLILTTNFVNQGVFKKVSLNEIKSSVLELMLKIRDNIN
jgi:ribonuclease P protein component